jgi:hypothetical protein
VISRFLEGSLELVTTKQNSAKIAVRFGSKFQQRLNSPELGPKATQVRLLKRADHILDFYYITT